MSVVLKSVVKDYPMDKLFVRALHGIELSIEQGEFTTFAGPSGCGKTTLLNLVGCIDTPTSGEVLIDGQKTTGLSDNQLTQLRLNKLGFIFQSFNLIPVLSVFQNIEFPLLLQGTLSPAERRKRVEEMIEKVGLTDRKNNRSNELSGGQRQRVAIARALVTRPRIVLADEPTANLDSGTGQMILELMKELNQQEKTTFIFSSHDPKIITQAKRIIHLSDGRVVNS